MKKLLSLVLVLAMVLGLSATALATTAYDLEINDVAVTAEGVVSNDAIKSGTVTYTAAENNNGIAKLTLNGATIQALNDGQDGISTESDLIIELIGENTVTVDGLGISVFGTLTFIGDGSLTVSSDGEAIGVFGNITFSMSGAVTATASNSSGISAGNGIIVTAGAGKVTAHGSGAAQFEYAGISIGTTDGVVSGCQTIIGSANSDETDESNMTNATLNSRFVVNNILFDKVFMVGDSVAKTVVLISNPATSGSTTITATKEEPELAYTIVIPTATTLTEEAHKDVRLGGEEGKASIDVTTGNSKTNVYYTVDLANGTLTDGTNTITTTYAYAQGGDYSALTDETKVTVYKSGTVQDSTVQVTADETSWTAAPAGTYTASVVFNFGTEDAEAEAPAAVTAADVLTTGAQYKLKATNTKSGSIDYSFTYEKTETGFELIEILEANSDKTELYSPACLSSEDGSNICFILGAGLTFTLDTSKNEYAFTGSDASMWTFTSFSVKPAGATEFTVVPITVAEPV